MTRETIRIELSSTADIGAARRASTVAAEKAGLGEDERGRTAVVATEAATNVVKHAGSGEILLDAAEKCLRMVVLDRGPGIADVARALEDGYSTAGTPGNGLGAIRRMSSAFDIYSRPGQGTALVARIAPKDAPPPPSSFAGLCVRHPSEVVCGDGFFMHRENGAMRLLVVDGIGHGTEAAKASDAAIDQFRGCVPAQPQDAISDLNAALRNTRGAAASVAFADASSRELQFCGVGNISAAIFDVTGKSRSLVSMNGTLGHENRTFRAYSYPWADGATLIVHSDGLGTRWQLDTYPGLLARDPALVAGVLFRDFARRRDDATVVVVRLGGGRSEG